jgi:hypothetical protein
MDLDGKLQALLEAEILLEGPDESISRCVASIVTHMRYTGIGNIGDVEKAVMDIEGDLAKVYLMRNFARLPLFLDKLREVTEPILLVRVSSSFVFKFGTNIVASKALFT